MKSTKILGNNRLNIEKDFIKKVKNPGEEPPLFKSKIKVVEFPKETFKKTSEEVQQHILGNIKKIPYENKIIQNALSAIYKDAFKKTLSTSNKTIKQQYEALSNPDVVVKSDSNICNIQLSDENFETLLYLIWLDMVHDGTINMNSDQFLEQIGTILVPGLKITSVSNNFIDTLEKKILTKDSYVKSKFEIDLLNVVLQHTNLKERPVKSNLAYVYRKENSKTYVFKSIYLSIDQDAELADSNELFSSSKIPKEKVLRGSSGNFKSAMKASKIQFDAPGIRSLITLANRMDPGRFMHSQGVVAEYRNLFTTSSQNINLKSLRFNFQDLTFILKSATYTMKIQIISNPDSDGTYAIKLNNTNIIQPGFSKADAKKSSNINSKLSKFFGDFLQTLTIIHLNRTNAKTNTMKNFPVIMQYSGDKMMVAMSLFLQKYMIENENEKKVMIVYTKSLAQEYPIHLVASDNIADKFVIDYLTVNSKSYEANNSNSENNGETSPPEGAVSERRTAGLTGRRRRTNSNTPEENKIINFVNTLTNKPNMTNDQRNAFLNTHVNTNNGLIHARQLVNITTRLNNKSQIKIKYQQLLNKAIVLKQKRNANKAAQEKANANAKKAAQEKANANAKKAAQERANANAKKAAQERANANANAIEANIKKYRISTFLSNYRLASINMQENLKQKFMKSVNYTSLFPNAKIKINNIIKKVTKKTNSVQPQNVSIYNTLNGTTKSMNEETPMSVNEKSELGKRPRNNGNFPKSQKFKSMKRNIYRASVI